MRALTSKIKALGRVLLHPLRNPTTWACQRGILSSAVREFMPWRWAREPFTVYGAGWKCRWYPTEFDAIGHRLFWSGLREWEKETSPVIFDNIRRSKCFIDVGANCGIYTVASCVINPKLRVVSIEPVPKVCSALTQNVTRNNLASQVTILNTAVGARNESISFHEANDATMGSLLVEGYRGQRGRIIQVDCRTLDSVVQELDLKPDFVKIDVEGFEDVVLSGSTNMLRSFRPALVLEVNPGGPADRLNEILLSHGYEFYNITASGLKKHCAIVPVDAFRNWLCVSP